MVNYRFPGHRFCLLNPIAVFETVKSSQIKKSPSPFRRTRHTTLNSVPGAEPCEREKEHADMMKQHLPWMWFPSGMGLRKFAIHLEPLRTTTYTVKHDGHEIFNIPHAQSRYSCRRVHSRKKGMWERSDKQSHFTTQIKVHKSRKPLASNFHKQTRSFAQNLNSSTGRYN